VLVRAAPAKKRNTSAIAGISSFKAAASGLPVLSDSSLANAGTVRFDAVGDAQQQVPPDLSARSAPNPGLPPRRRRRPRRPASGSPRAPPRCICRWPDRARVSATFLRRVSAPLIKSLVCIANSSADRRALFLLGIIEGQVCAVAGPLTFLPRICSRVPCTAAGTSRRAIAIDLPVKVETMAQVTTPTFLSPEYTHRPCRPAPCPRPAGRRS
jgi:hypothetical protein